MKRVLFFVGLVAISGNIALAQTSNVRKAKSNYARYEELGGLEAGELATKFLKDALTPIDAAIEHDKTKEDAEAWTVYSLIYSNLALAEKSADYAQKSIQGLEKAEALDTDNKQEANIDATKITLRNYYQTIGYDAWQEEDFKSAYDAFDKGLQISAGDTTLLYYGAVAAIQTQDYDNAVKKYEELIPVKEFSEHKTIASDLPKLYLSIGDTTKALEYAAKAAQDYPDDNDVAFQNIELNLVVGNEQQTIKDIEAQLAKESDNKVLHYYLGIAYTAAENDEKALEAYKSALAIDPEYVEANLNAAAVIMNLSNQAIMDLNDDKTLSNEDYAAKVEELKKQMGGAVPYLESAIKAEPDNRNALRNLKSYYDFISDEEKSAEVQAKIDAL